MTEKLHETPTPKPPGVLLLELFDFQDHIGREISVVVGGVATTIRAENFLDVCGEHAGPVIEALLDMDRHDPEYLESFAAVREMTADYLGIDVTHNT